MWSAFGENINNAFYFVIDKIVDLMEFFRKESLAVGEIVLLIALLTAALNYALTGAGLKENLIKILKATLFFIIVAAAYPRIVSWITWYTFDLASRSVYEDVRKHFEAVTEEITQSYTFEVSTPGQADINMLFSNQYHPEKKNQSFTNTYVTKIYGNDKQHLFSGLSEKRGPDSNKMKMSYTVVPPAAVLKIVFFIAGECLDFADKKDANFFPSVNEMSRIFKGLVCAGVIIFTGSFALLEYVVCFLEFMLVASVGIILLPLSIWEGSKFMSEGFIKSILGFFVKLLFCNLAIFLLIYGFITLFYIMSTKQADQSAMAFSGNVEQIIFIVFTCLLFLFICKSAPGVAQSLLSGSPSLTGAGAVGAVAGAIGTAAAVGGMARSAVSTASNAGKSLVGGAAKTGGAFIEAGSAAHSAGMIGNSRAGAFMRSFGRNASQGLARSLTGGRSGDKSVGDLVKDRISEGDKTGRRLPH